MCQNWDKVKKRPWYYTSLWTWASISRTDVDLCSGLTMSALKEKWSEDQLCCYNEPVLIKPFSFSWGLWKIGNMLPHIRLLNSYNLSGYNWDIFFSPQWTSVLHLLVTHGSRMWGTTSGKFKAVFNCKTKLLGGHFVPEAILYSPRGTEWYSHFLLIRAPSEMVS